VRNVNSGELRVFDKSAQVVLPEGRYFAEASARDKHVFKREEFELLSGERKELSISDWSASPPHRAIAEHLPTGGGGVDFSESLGAMVRDPDLDLWLALLGGGRILGSTGDYSKIARFPLHNFSGERAGASPIYVLAGLSDPGAVLRVGVSHTDIVPWNPATEPPGMRGIREAYFATPPGPYLVSIAVGGGAPYTVASHASPNRATLVTVSLADDGAPHIGQYLLPIGHLIGQLDPDVRDRLQQRNHLRDVRFLANASRAFRRRRDVAKAMGSAELEDLLYAKWLDPIASSLAAYEYIRRGRKDLIGDVVHNMKRYFKDLPDTWALAKLAGEPAPRPYAPPLFFDGLRSSPDFGEWLPLAAGHLDFSSTWTAWRAAVKPLGSP
jgi:hypothetical protein